MSAQTASHIYNFWLSFWPGWRRSCWSRWKGQLTPPAVNASSCCVPPTVPGSLIQPSCADSRNASIFPYPTGKHCEIIYTHWTFNFMYLIGGAVHEFKIPMKYLFTLVTLHIIWNSRIHSNVHEHVQCRQTTKDKVQFGLFWAHRLFFVVFISKVSPFIPCFENN